MRRGKGFDVVVAIVLAVRGQLVVDEIGKNFLELEEKTFAWSVAVGVHVKRDPSPCLPRG